MGVLLRKTSVFRKNMVFKDIFENSKNQILNNYIIIEERKVVSMLCESPCILSTLCTPINV